MKSHVSKATAADSSYLSAGAEPMTIHCLEVWGGTERNTKTLVMPGLQTSLVCHPYQNKSSGGDIYYVSSCGAGDIARFCLADVSGHDTTASCLADRLRGLMQKNVDTLDQTEFAQLLNNEFSALVEHGRFATALLTACYISTGHLVVCNAGHPRPLLYRKRTRRWQYLDNDVDDCLDSLFNLPLGVLEPTRYAQFAVQLEPEDTVLMYTDAALEASDSDGRPLGEAGLLALVDALPVAPRMHYCETLLAAIKADHTLTDDLTLAAMTFRPGGNTAAGDHA